MALSRDRCICIRKFEYSETSQILTLFSRDHGRLQLIAKGAHRRTKAGASKFDGGVDLLDVGEAVFSHSPERELSPLCEWRLIEGHLALRGNLRAMQLGLYAAELITMLFEEHDPHPELFVRLDRMFIELATPSIEEVFLLFELDLLREAGYMPRLGACAICGVDASTQQDRGFFSPAHGGFVCRNCEGSAPDRHEIDPRLLRVVRSIATSRDRLPRLTRHQTDPINAMLATHIEHTLGRRMRMPRWILRAETTSASTRKGSLPVTAR